MRILVVNVNTTASLTESIAARARAAASPGTQIVGLTPCFGAASVESHFESYLSAVAVMDRVLRYEGPYDAVIQAGFGEHGREGLQELVGVPVVDITEAAASVAMLLGRRYSVITTLDRTVPMIEDRLRLAGLDRRCASIRAAAVAVLDLERHTERACDAIAQEAATAISADAAEVICLGCAGMAGLDILIRERTGVPVVDGVAAAVALAESLVRLDLRTSKVRSYAYPHTKALVGWPLTFPE